MPTAGPNFPTAATGNTGTIGGGTLVWVNPTNIEANDGASATAATTIGITTDDLIGTAFGFAIVPTDTINGILLEVKYNSNTANLLSEHAVNLLKAGVSSGTNKSTSAALPVTPTIVTYGGSADLWGTTWTPADINNANFGAATSYTSGGTKTANVDFFRITIFSTSAPAGQSQMFKMF